MENSVHQRRFQAAVKVMKTLPADGAFLPSDDMLIKFYTYHKQATVGACNTTEPCSRDALSQAKREAWKALGDMSKEDAMKAYVEELLQILEMIPVTEEVSDLLDVLEPFYEVVEDENENEDNNTTSKPALSTFSDETGLTVANRVERGGSPVSNDSVSSLTKSTQSSLNTDEEEEELEHSRETSRETSRDTQHHFFPLRADDGGDVSEPEQPCEVYSDSVRAEEGSGGLRPAAAPAKKPEGRGANTEDVGVSQDGKPRGAALPPLCTAAHGPVQSVILSTGRRRAGQSVAPLSNVVTSNNGTVSESVVTDPVKTQIAVALSRLQDDMRSVLVRLNALEARALSKVKRLALCREPHHTALTNNRLPKCPSLISQVSVAFLLAWPFVAHLLVQLYLKKKSVGRTNIAMDEGNRAEPSNWIIQHPVYQEMLNLGVDDSAQVYRAFLVYLDLTEVRRWTGVVAVPCPALKAVLLEGRAKEGEALQVVYPLPAQGSVSHRNLRRVACRGNPMLLCAVASDSTLVYQRLSDGMVTPDPPVDIKDLGRRQHRKRRRQT